MKAADYFEKYQEGLRTRTAKVRMCAVKDLFFEMSEETTVIAKSRGSNQHDMLLVSVLKEQNQKWNAIVTIFLKKYGDSPLLNNGFIHYWETELPAVKALNEKKKIQR